MTQTVEAEAGPQDSQSGRLLPTTIVLAAKEDEAPDVE
jgi:hypothetical protein